MNNKLCYHGGKSFDAIGSDFSNLGEKNFIIRADVTDAWYDPYPKIKDVLLKDINWFIKNSPPTQAEGLIKTVSKIRKIPKENILVGGGSSDLMFLLFPNILGKNNEILILDPMYGEYAHILEKVIGTKIQRIYQDKKDGFKIKVSNIIEKITSNTAMIILVNPNNPTGQYIEKKDILKLLSNIPKNVLLCIDETYIDYIGKGESLEREVGKYKNLIVLKSMSKIYALSGVRVAYLVATENIIPKLSLLNPPWSVNLIGQLSGVIALKNEKYYLQMINETKKINEYAQKELSKIKGIKPIKSHTNFILIELIDKNLNASNICKNLEKKGIFIRNPNSQSTQFRDNFIRISIKDKENTKRIIKELKKQIK